MPVMTLNKHMIIALCVAVPISCISVLFIIGYFILHRIRTRGYNLVNHGLDDEELNFKKSIEATNLSKLEEKIMEDGEEEEFSTDDLDRLQMLENFRNNLVAGASADVDTENGVEVGNEEVDNIRL
jgi:hypothetical protein